MSVTLAIVVATIIALAIGGSLVLGAPVFAIPILLLLPGPFIAADVLRRQRRLRQVRRFRQQAKAQKVEFDAGDKRTLA